MFYFFRYMSSAKISSLIIVTSTTNIQYALKTWNSYKSDLKLQIGTQSENNILFIKY